MCSQRQVKFLTLIFFYHAWNILVWSSCTCGGRFGSALPLLSLRWTLYFRISSLPMTFLWFQWNPKVFNKLVKLSKFQTPNSVSATPHRHWNPCVASYKAPGSLLSMHSSENSKEFEKNLYVDVRTSYIGALSFLDSPFQFPATLTASTPPCDTTTSWQDCGSLLEFWLLHSARIREQTGSKHISPVWIPSFKSLIPSSFLQLLITLQCLWVVFKKLLSKVDNCLWEG